MKSGLKTQWRGMTVEEKDAAYDAAFLEELGDGGRPPKIYRIADRLNVSSQAIDSYLKDREARTCQQGGK